jgi:hypothetical protein
VALAEAWDNTGVADAHSVELQTGIVASCDFLVLGRRMRVLTGTVVRGSAPVAGATVRVLGQPGDSVTTDARGRFRVDALLTDVYVVIAVEEGKDGASVGSAELVLDSPSAAESLVVELPRVYRTGRVVDAATGAPVAGAEVFTTVGDTHGPWSLAAVRGATQTDAEGRFRVTAPSDGDGVLTVGAEGYAPASSDFAASDTQAAQVELARGREVRVRVVRDPALRGKPLLVFAGSDGFAHSLGVNGGFAEGEAITLRLLWDVGWLSVLSDDTVPSLTLVSEKDADVEVRLVAAGSLRIVVLDRRGEPFVGASVGLSPIEGKGLAGEPVNPWRERPDYVTWRDGTVVRHGLPAGRYVVNAASPTGVTTTTTVDVVAGPATEVVLKLE